MKAERQRKEMSSRVLDSKHIVSNVSIIDNRPVLQYQGVIQRLGGVANNIHQYIGTIPCQIVGQHDLYIPSNGGFPHIHAWGDGCGVHHLPGIGGNLVNANQKNQNSVNAAIQMLLEYLIDPDGNRRPDAELAGVGGAVHIRNVLRGVHLINRIF